MNLLRRSNRMIAALVLVLWLAGCTTTSSNEQSSQTSAQFNQRADIHLQLAIAYYEQRQLAIALEEAELALQAAPNFIDAIGMRALIDMEMGATQRAKENFLHGLKLAPNNPDLANNYGWFLCNNEQADQALTYFDTALKNKAYRSPHKALLNAGLCSLKLNQTQLAASYFTQVLQYETNNPVANLQLAKLYADQGNAQRARLHLDSLAKNKTLSSDVLWAALKIAHQLSYQSASRQLAAQLQLHYPTSLEYAAYRRGAFDE